MLRPYPKSTAAVATVALLLILVLSWAPVSGVVEAAHYNVTATPTATPGGLTVAWDEQSHPYINLYQVEILLGTDVEESVVLTGYPSTGDHTFTGLQPATTYAVRVRHGYAAPLDNIWYHWESTTGTTQDAYEFDCTPSLNPSVSLGTLGNTAGASLSSSGSIPTDLDDLPCSDDDDRASKYFTFVIATGEEGAVRIEADQGNSTMRPELLLRSGSDTYTGTVLFHDKRADVRDALAAGLVGAGTYTLQVRSTVPVDGGAGRGGTFSVSVVRILPTLTYSTTLGSSSISGWDVGAPVSNSSLNTVSLTVKVDYKETSAATWTAQTASVSPGNGDSRFITTITGLTAGNTYIVRAAYTNSTTFVETASFRIFGPARLSAAPFDVQGSVEPVNEATGQYAVSVQWATPYFSVDANTTWGYWLRLNGREPFSNPTGNEQAQHHHFLYSQAETLNIEVRNNFKCTVSTGHCDITYDSVDYDIPALKEWVTVWSIPATVRIPGTNSIAGGDAAQDEPDQAVVELIYTIMDATGMTRSAALARTLSVLVCLALAFAAAFAVTAKFGMRLAPVVVATLVWYTVFAGLGLEFFGVPAALVAILVIIPLALGGYGLVRRFAQ